MESGPGGLQGGTDETRRLEGEILRCPKWTFMSDLAVVSTAPETELLEIEAVELSPEVMLVDPDLAVTARELRARHEATPEWPRPAPAVSRPDHRVLEARQRLLDAGIASDVLGSVVPDGRHLRRRATLVPALSAATSVALFVVQLYLGQGVL
jgi:hypothetical protein